MKQFEKIYNFIKNPRVYGIRKNTRVYKHVCNLVCTGIVQTGFSDKNSKHIETWDVVHVLDRLGVACGAKNVAPRGGACGERVFLTGKVRRDCLANCKKYVDDFLLKHPEKNYWDAQFAFIASLQK